MYVPPAFREDRPEVLRALIHAHPLAALVTAGADGLAANLTPFILVETPDGDVLRAHMARANGQFDSLRSGAEVLTIFQGPQAYITPSWYATKAEHGKVVPTWNYAVVQAWGTPRVIDDADWVLAQVTGLTTVQESRRAAPWAVTDAPEAYVAAQLRGIVGLEIPVRRIEGKWKVSQNQPEANRRSVVSGLRDAASDEMADLVEERARGLGARP
jgi:transcriptional regulator